MAWSSLSFPAVHLSVWRWGLAGVLAAVCAAALVLQASGRPDGAFVQGEFVQREAGLDACVLAIERDGRFGDYRVIPSSVHLRQGGVVADIDVVRHPAQAARTQGDLLRLQCRVRAGQVSLSPRPLSGLN